MATPPKTTVDKAAKWDENDEDEITDEDFEDIEPPKPPADEEGWMNETEIMEDILEQYDAEEEAKEKAKKEKGDHHMATSDYFDTRALIQHPSSSDRKCPVGACNKPLQPPVSEKGMPWCSDHGIRIASRSFVYKNPLDNIRFERSYFEHCIWKNNAKAESHRFGNENSEDALTWNVFASLARQRRLSALSRCFSQFATNEEPELYLWGLRVNLDDPTTIPTTFAELGAARKIFERGINKMNTEPDIMLYVPNRFLILVEAKFTSGNTTVKPGETDKDGEKPKTRKGILRRYNANKLPSGSLLTPADETPLYSQLYRNLVFAIHMADQLKVQWGLVNLTLKRAYEEVPDDLATFANAALPLESRQRFVRYTWEKLFRDHVEGNEDLQKLDTYLRYKSANCGPAFEI